jgi:WD40 repeat protein|mmetsp:Transcript_35309/g.6375  ORF Transcript_35309/g.6375 Transcript_35309/m.6375 type:complete len:174 (-) Transcript_35309:2172-2693(-)
MSLSFQTEDKLIMALTNSQLFSIDFNSDSVQGEPLAQNFHTGEITGLDVCIRKPLVVTCGLDKTIRIWNYQERELEICSSFNEEPYSVAFHPSGFHIVAGFADKLRMMNVTHNAIKSYKDISIRSCREVRFSYGGHLFAAASGSMIKVFNFYTAEGPPNFEFKSHSARVVSIA